MSTTPGQACTFVFCHGHVHVMAWLEKDIILNAFAVHHWQHTITQPQCRGSIPLLWTQLPNIKYKPPTKLLEGGAATIAFDTHFDALLDTYKVCMFVCCVWEGYEGGCRGCTCVPCASSVLATPTFSSRCLLLLLLLTTTLHTPTSTHATIITTTTRLCAASTWSTNTALRAH